MCIKLVNYRGKYTEMHGQQNGNSIAVRLLCEKKEEPSTNLLKPEWFLNNVQWFISFFAQTILYQCYKYYPL